MSGHRLMLSRPMKANEHRRIARLAAAMEQWFGESARELPWRDAYEPWHVWVAEIMLQQTRMDVVLRYFDRFIERFPSVESLAASSTDEVLSSWSGLGYYRRARMLHQGARHVVEHHDGVIPSDLASLLAIPGIGRYTAGAIASIAFDARTPLADGNVFRLYARLEDDHARIGSSALTHGAWAFAGAIVEAARSPRVVNQAMMELGARICTPRRPSCPSCPLASDCRALQAGSTEQTPRPRARVARGTSSVPLYLVDDGAGRLLMRREMAERFRGMLLFPLGSDELASDQSSRFENAGTIATFRHAIMNRQIVFDVCVATLRGDHVADGSDEWLWIEPERIDEHPHPSWVRKAIEARRATARKGNDTIDK